jgi:LysR family transcriptional regulator, transcriptional activator for dmlA
VNAFGSPANPDELAAHRCAGSGVWKLSRGSKEVSPNIAFHVVTSDPGINLPFALDGLGITVLPLWMAKHPDNRSRLVPILPLWKPEPITLCALFPVRLDSRQK